MTYRGRKTSANRPRVRSSMSVSEAYKLLGLTPDAQWERVHATYRRDALRYHPDRNPDEASLERFKEQTAAYRLLRKKYRLDADSDRPRCECERCGDYAVLHTAPDGTRCCAACLSLASRQPLLPAPPITIVSCAATIVLLVLAVGCLAAEALVGGGSYSAAALGLGILSLMSLAATCLTVVYTAQPRRGLYRGTVQAIHPAPTEIPIRLAESADPF